MNVALDEQSLVDATVLWLNRTQALAGQLAQRVRTGGKVSPDEARGLVQRAALAIEMAAKLEVVRSVLGQVDEIRRYLESDECKETSKLIKQIAAAATAAGFSGDGASGA